MSEAPTQLAAAADQVLRTKHGTTLKIILLDASEAGQALRITSAQLSEQLGFDVSYEAVRRWTDHYLEAEDGAAA